MLSLVKYQFAKVPNIALSYLVGAFVVAHTMFP